MDEMMYKICEYNNGTYLKVEWNDGQDSIFGKIDTIYETDNGLEPDDPEYKEFYAFAFMIEKIYKNSTYRKFQKNNLIEISSEDLPTLITLDNGNIIFKK